MFILIQRRNYLLEKTREALVELPALVQVLLFGEKLEREVEADTSLCGSVTRKRGE